jgi:antirestriction protein ArdC
MQWTEKQDIYSRITNQIVSHLEKGVRPWVRPWNAEHGAGRNAISLTAFVFVTYIL